MKKSKVLDYMAKATEKETTGVRVSVPLMDRASVAFYDKKGRIPQKQDLVKEALELLIETYAEPKGKRRDAS